MKKIISLFVGLMMFTAVVQTQAQDSLLFTASTVVVKSGTAVSTYAYDKFQYQNNFGLKYEIYVGDKTVWAGKITDLKFKTATTTQQKLDFLATKVRSSPAYIVTSTQYVAQSDVVIPADTYKRIEILPKAGSFKYKTGTDAAIDSVSTSESFGDVRGGYISTAITITPKASSKIVVKKYQ